MFELGFETGEEIKLIKKFNEFCGISEVYLGVFATVIDRTGMTGVIDWKGNIVIPAQYKTIEYDFIYDEDSVWIGDDIVFTCYEEDGTVEKIEKKW